MKKDKQQGVALILVLWVLSILMLMSSSFSLTMRRESSGVMAIKDNAQANAYAQSGIAIAQAMLLNEDEEKRWRVDGSIYEIETDNAKMRIRLFSETGKIDINSVTADLLHKVLFHAPIESQEQVKLEQAILDWRDEDETMRPFGAEKAEYQALKLSYSPRNKPFRSLEELQMVRGMTEDVFNWMKPIFTVYAAGQTEVDLRLASPDVLSVLPDVDSTLLDAYFLARQQSITNHAPLPQIPRAMNSGQAMASDMENQTEAEVAPEISVVSLTIETLLENDSHGKIEVVMEKIDGANNLPFQVLTWQKPVMTNAEESLFSNAMDMFLVRHYLE